MNTTHMIAIAGAAILATSAFAKEDGKKNDSGSGKSPPAEESAGKESVNSGLTFYEEKKPDDKKDEGKKDSAASPRNIDGISFDIAEKKDPKQIDWIKRSKRGSRGNVTCYVDKDGVPTAVFVIGVAPVSTTMIAVEAEEEAHFEAESNAKEAFALWMHEFVSVENVREKKTLVVRTDGEEHSETETKNKRVFTQTAEASWRGMSVFADALKDGRYISIWRWSVQEQELAHMVEQLTQDKDPNSVKKDRKTDWTVEEREFSFRDED